MVLVPAAGRHVQVVAQAAGRPVVDARVRAAGGEVVAVASRGGARFPDGAGPCPDDHLCGALHGTEVRWVVPPRAAGDARGRYVVQGVGLGEAHVVEACRAGHASASPPALRAPADGSAMRGDPVLPRGARLAMRGVDPGGRPIPGVSGSASRRATSYGASGQGSTDENGVLTFVDLGAGTYDVGLQPKPGPGTPGTELGQAA